MDMVRNHKNLKIVLAIGALYLLYKLYWDFLVGPYGTVNPIFIWLYTGPGLDHVCSRSSSCWIVCCHLFFLNLVEVLLHLWLG